MRALAFCLAGLLLALPAMAQEAPAAPQVISAGDLIVGKAIILGRFGQPLGECVKLRAKIYEVDERKGSNGDYLLLVSHVNGKELPRPVGGVEFTVTGLAVGKIANDAFQLYEMRTGQKAKFLNTQIKEQLNVGYVGSTVEVIVYETGGFYGKANNLPKGIPEGPAMQMRSPSEYHFELSLYAVKVEDQPRAAIQSILQK